MTDHTPDFEPKHRDPDLLPLPAEPVSTNIPTARTTADVAAPETDTTGPPRSLRGDAWRDLRSNPLFWISAAIIVVFVLMAAFPGLFTGTDPREAVLAEVRKKPNFGGENPFGRDGQGYDIYARCIYGARASLLIGLLASIGTAVVGSIFGLVAGYAGGVIDAVVGRIAEIFFALPLLLGAIVILTSLRTDLDGPIGSVLNLVFSSDSYMGIIFQVVMVLVVLGWPSIYRLMRSSVLQVMPNDYIQAARAVGASPLRISFSHILPNCLGPVIVVSTINLGAYISAEAALSFLGIGLLPPTISWGVMVDQAQSSLTSAPHVLIFPSLFLSAAVLGFIMLGDAVRDAFDPKSR